VNKEDLHKEDKNHRVCVVCKKGGSDQLPIYRHPSFLTEPLDGYFESLGPAHEIHADIKGPFRIPSLIHKARFILVVTVRPGKYLFLGEMRTKGETAVTLESILLQLDIIHKNNTRLNGMQYATQLWTDAESVWYDEKVTRMLVERKINHRPSAPYKKQMNGVIEREIKSLFNKANTFMLEYNVPLSFWLEALVYASVVINYTPRQQLKWQTPFNLMYGRPPDYSLLHAFYAPGLCVLSPAERRGGILGLGQTHAVECRFLGIEDTAYIIWVPKYHQVMRRRDCEFEQNLFVTLDDKEREIFLEHYPELTNDALMDQPTLTEVPDFFEDHFEDEYESWNDINKHESSVADRTTEENFSDSNCDLTTIESQSLMVKDERRRWKGESMVTSEHETHGVDPTFSPQKITSSTIHDILDEIKNARKQHEKDQSSRKLHRYDPSSSKDIIGELGIDSGELRIASDREAYTAPAYSAYRAKKSLSLGHVPSTMEEAILSKDTAEVIEWIAAYEKEINNLTLSGTWRMPTSEELQSIHEAAKTKRPIDTKFVLVKKLSPEGDMIYKVRLAVRGFKQIYMVDYDDTYAPTLNRTSMKLIMYLCMSIWQFTIQLIDFKQAFAQSELEEEIPIELPKFMRQKADEPVYVILTKALYGLKQAALAWYMKLSTALTEELNMKRLDIDPCVFIRYSRNRSIKCIVTIHVDDMMIAAKSKVELEEFQEEMLRVLPDFKRFRNFDRYLGININIDESQQIIAMDLHERIEQLHEMLYEKYGLFNDHGWWNPTAQKITVPMREDIKDVAVAKEDSYEIDQHWVKELQVVHGSLRYIVDTLRSDAASALGMLSKTVSRPINGMEAMKLHVDIVEYLNRTKDISLILGGKVSEIKLCAFSDASRREQSDSKGRLGIVIYAHPQCGAILVKSVKEQTVSHSSMESEIMAIDMAIRHIVAIRTMLDELGFKQEYPTLIYIDSKSGKELCDSLRVTDKSRHFNSKLNYIRQEINVRSVELVFIPGNLNVADIMTKNLAAPKYKRFRSWLMGGIPMEIWKEINLQTKGKAHNAFYAQNDFIVDWYY